MSINRIVLTSILFIFLFSATGRAVSTEVSSPDISINLAVQGVKFYGDTLLATVPGYEELIDRIDVRQAILGLSGKVDERVVYNFEAGFSWTERPGQFWIIDARIQYQAIRGISIGAAFGDMERGYISQLSAIELLTAEKPRFYKTFVPCEPRGFFVRFERPFRAPVGFSLEAAVLDDGFLTEGAGWNLGLVLHLLHPGLSFGVHQQTMDERTGYDEKSRLITGEIKRRSFGFQYDYADVLLRGEYFWVKGLKRDFYYDVERLRLIQPEDYVSHAYYVEGAYTWHTGKNWVPALRPYTRFQSWNQAPDAYGEHTLQYLTMGLTIFVDRELRTSFKIDYEGSVNEPGEVDEKDEMLILRMQVGI
jgi:hypothetical protein